MRETSEREDAAPLFDVPSSVVVNDASTLEAVAVNMSPLFLVHIVGDGVGSVQQPLLGAVPKGRRSR